MSIHYGGSYDREEAALTLAFNPYPAGLEALLASERPRLVRLCARLTGDLPAAEDIAQETLLVAWRNVHQLRDPQRCSQWLSGIARNRCRNWVRRRQRENALLEASDSDLHLLSARDRFVNTVDIEVELERSALVELLDRAIALLPPETRDVLIQRYVEDSPYAEIAARLGLSEDAVAMRISRSRLALRRVLTTELIDDAAAFGLVNPSATAWQETRIWCPLCGSQQLQGQLDPPAGVLRLRCARCNLPDSPLVSSGPSEPLPVKTYKPALVRLLAWIHDYYQVQAHEGSVRCLRCGRELRLQCGRTPPALQIGQPPLPHGIYRMLTNTTTVEDLLEVLVEEYERTEQWA